MPRKNITQEDPQKEFKSFCRTIGILNGSLTANLDYVQVMDQLFIWAGKKGTLKDGELRLIRDLREQLLTDIVSSVARELPELDSLTRYILLPKNQALLFRIKPTESGYEKYNPLVPFKEFLWKPMLELHEQSKRDTWLFGSCEEYLCLFFRTALVLCIYDASRPGSKRKRDVREAFAKMKDLLMEVICNLSSEQKFLFWMIFLALCCECMYPAVTQKLLEELYEMFSEEPIHELEQKFAKDSMLRIQEMVRPKTQGGNVARSKEDSASRINSCDVLENLEDQLRTAPGKKKKPECELGLKTIGKGVFL